MEEVVKDAIKLGMDEICFTDHVDYGVKEDWDSGRKIEYRGSEPYANVDYPRYMESIDRMRERYGGEITVRAGLEFGIQTHTIPRYEALFQRYPFDFIILSIHQVGDKEFWTQDFQRGKTQREYNEQYYEEMLEMCIRDRLVLGIYDDLSQTALQKINIAGVKAQVVGLGVEKEGFLLRMPPLLLGSAQEDSLKFFFVQRL